MLAIAMVRKRRNINTFAFFKKLKKESYEDYNVYCFRELRYQITYDDRCYGCPSEQYLIEMVEAVSSLVLQMVDEEGNLLLYYALANNYNTLAMKIWELYPNAVKHQKQWWDRNPLHIAIIQGRHDIIQILLDGELTYSEYELLNKEDYYRETALYYACSHNNHKLVKKILYSISTNINHQDVSGKTAFHICCEQKAKECIEIFCNDESVNPFLKDCNDQTPFVSYINATTIFLPSWRRRGNPPVPPRKQQFDEHIINILAQKEYKYITNNDDKRGFNVLHANAKSPRYTYDTFNYLLDSSSAQYMLNQQDEFGNTPLHYATEEFFVNKLINQPGVQIDVKNDKGRTPFHFACYNARSFIIKDFLKRPDVNLLMIDNGGENALHHMMQGLRRYHCNSAEYMNSLNILLNANPFLVNNPNKSNESAYEYAIKMQNAFDFNQNYFILNRKTIDTTNEPDYVPDETKRVLPFVIQTLKDYQTEARHRMFKALIKIH